jgi:hypothetical protein
MLETVGHLQITVGETSKSYSVSKNSVLLVLHLC